MPISWFGKVRAKLSLLDQSMQPDFDQINELNKGIEELQETKAVFSNSQYIFGNPDLRNAFSMGLDAVIATLESRVENAKKNSENRKALMKDVYKRQFMMLNLAHERLLQIPADKQGADMQAYKAEVEPFINGFSAMYADPLNVQVDLNTQEQALTRFTALQEKMAKAYGQYLNLPPLTTESKGIGSILTISTNGQSVHYKCFDGI